MKTKITLYIVIVFLLLSSIDFVVQKSLTSQYYSQSVANVSQTVASVRANIEKEIVSNLLLIHGTANYISVHPKITNEEFALYASGALSETSLLKNLGAAPGFVLRYVYPLSGNESVIGLDYRNIPEQWSQVKKAWETREMVVAGPINLFQGGRGFIGRAPVFVKDGSSDSKETEKFWGIVSAVIDADRLLDKAVLSSVHDINIAIRGADGKGADGGVFWGDRNLFDSNVKPVLAEVSFPSGSWQIAAVPSGGWPERHPAAIKIHVIFFILFCVFIYVGYREFKSRLELFQSKKELDEAQALAHIGSWSYNVKNDSVWWSDETYRIFGVEKSDFTPTLEAFVELVHPQEQEEVMDVYHRSVANKKFFKSDHKIVRPDGTVRYVHERGNHQFDSKGEILRSFGTVHDITEREVITKKLMAEQAKIRAMAEATYDPLIMIDSSDNIIFWSPAAEKTFGWTHQEAVGQKMHPLIIPREYLEEAQEGLRRFAKEGTGPVLNSIMEFPAIRKSGEVFHVERAVSAFQVDGEYYAVGMLRDITERKSNEDELSRLATTDPLTGILNRRRFLELADYEIRRCKRHGCALSFVMFDADNFKKINDTYGHDVGDQVLVTITSAASRSLREVDNIGRIGGEEFIILLPDTPLSGALILAERLRSIIGKIDYKLEDGKILNFTVSLGVTQLIQSEDVDSVLKRADMAMYKAKHNGRNRVESA